MRIEVSGSGGLFLREVFAGISFETEAGEVLAVCMRDSGYEVRYGDSWWEFKEGQVRRMGGPSYGDTPVSRKPEPSQHGPEG